MTAHYDIDGREIPRDELRNLAGKFEIIGADSAAASARFYIPNQLYTLWQSLPGTPPHFSHFKPGVVDPALLPNSVLMDVVGEGEDYKFRVYGTAHVTHFGADLTGLNVSEVEKINPASTIIRQVYDRVMEQCGAVFFTLDYLNQNDVVKQATGVMLPLAGDDGKISRLYGGMDWFSV